MIRLENNRVDKILIKKYLEEIESVVKNIEGLDDIDSYRSNFEKEFANFIGTKYAIAVNSGTDALQLALLALGISKGDTVILPDLTYISTALVIKYVGAELILVDIKKEDLTIDETKIEENIRPNTKAIIAVHMFGNPCNMKELIKICQKRKLYLIEDACQALGSKYYGRYIGTFGNISAFSFSYYKPLSSLAGNGGMVVFNKEEYYEKINRYFHLWKEDKILLDLDRKFNKISLIDLVTTRIKLKYIKNIIDSREKIKRIYEDKLQNIKQIKVFKDKENCFSLKENYPIMVKEIKYRDKLYKFLYKNKIKVDLPYKPIHLLNIFRNSDNEKQNFPITENYYQSALHLPLYTFMSEEECKYVIKVIQHFFNYNKK